MAVRAREHVPAPSERRSSSPYRGSRERPAGGFELWSWLFMRISGLVLLILAVGHILIMHVLDEGVEFLSKPYSLEHLARRVREVLDKPQP